MEESAFPLTGVAIDTALRPLTTGISSVEATETQKPSELNDLDVTAIPADNSRSDAKHETKLPFVERPGVETYADWNPRDVSTFITTSCDLPQYEAAIKSNKITGSDLRELRSHDMLNIGLLRAGIRDHDHQRRISDEMMRVERGSPDLERDRLAQTVQTWEERRKFLQVARKPQKAVGDRANWDTKRRELSFGRLTTCYMPGKGPDAGRYMYGPRLDLTRTAKLMRREASVPAQLFSSETRKTMQPYDPRRHSAMAGAAASSRGLVKVAI